MTESNLDFSFESPAFRSAAVVGLGYVGLPLAVALAQSGLPVVGVDNDEDRVEGIRLGFSPTEGVGARDLNRVLGENLQVTSDFSAVVGVDVAVICVPTPLGSDNEPDLDLLIDAATRLAPNLKRGCLVVVESTSYPGTTEEVVMPIIQRFLPELDTDFFLAFSPERIDPGNMSFSLSNTPRLVGGASERSGQIAKNFYELVVSEVIQLSGSREAEMAKLLENTYRQVNIALVNEIAIVCRALNIDVFQVIRGASSKPFGFQAFFPGPGVGGHCIPIDPMYLNSKVEGELGVGVEFISLAQRINKSMPAYVAGRAVEELEALGKGAPGSRVLVLGVSYKNDVGDTRESPAYPIIDALVEAGLTVEFHDPGVKHFETSVAGAVNRVENWAECLEEFDLAVVLQAHESYRKSEKLAHGPNVLDCTGKVQGVSRRLF